MVKKNSVTADKATSKGDHQKPATHHRDGTGHLDPAYEARLKAQALEKAVSNTERAFINGSSSDDPMAEEAGEEFVMAATSGEDAGETGLDEETAEERGGPFLEVPARGEFAKGTDESNPSDATREPFPTT